MSLDPHLEQMLAAQGMGRATVPENLPDTYVEAHFLLFCAHMLYVAAKSFIFPP